MGQPRHRHDVAHVGLVPIDQLATGTPDGSKFLRDDGSWATAPGSGGMTNPMTAEGDMIVGGPAISAPTYYAETLPMFAYSNAPRTNDQYAQAGAVGGACHLLQYNDTITWSMTGPGTFTSCIWFGGIASLSEDGTVVQTGLGAIATFTQVVPAGTHTYVLTNTYSGATWGTGFDGVTLTPTGTIPAGYPVALPYVADGDFLVGVSGAPAYVAPADARTAMGLGTAATTATTAYDAAGAAAAITLAGLGGFVDHPLAMMGTAFPTGSALTAYLALYGANAPFYRLDLGEWYYYDGTRWLSAVEYAFQASKLETMTADTGGLWFWAFPQCAIAITAMDLNVNDTSGGSSTSNYWIFKFYTQTGNSGSGALATWNTYSGPRSSYFNAYAQQSYPIVIAAGPQAININSTHGGTVSTIYCTCAIRYRKIAL
jgi:hypothetical protein